MPQLKPGQIERICKVIADTGRGFTGQEIGMLLGQIGVSDTNPNLTKWKRLYQALALRVNSTGSTNIVWTCISRSLEPSRGLDNRERYLWMLKEINGALSFTGYEIQEDGRFHHTDTARTLSEAAERTQGLRQKLESLGAHPEVLKCCREELLVDDYFHAVHEAAKSLCKRVKTMTGLDLDGTKLFETAFSTKAPYIVLASPQNESWRNQQNGLKELLNGVMHLIRNPTAHELRIHWDINEKDAVDVLSLISYLHKLLDSCAVVRKST